MKTISIMIPCYNEQANIREIVELDQRFYDTLGIIFSILCQEPETRRIAGKDKE